VSRSATRLTFGARLLGCAALTLRFTALTLGHTHALGFAALALGSFAHASDTPGKPAPVGISVARSALLTVDATPTGDDSVVLQIRRVADHSVVASDDVTVTVDGKNQTVTRQTDGTYLVSGTELRGDDARAVEVTVGHDGIREVLSGKVTLPAPSTTSLLGEHKQVAWWILNVVVVLIAVIALSRRKS